MVVSHLILLIHGLNGAPSDMQFIFDRLCTHLDREAPGIYLVHNTTANDDVFRFSFKHKTYDGIRAGGDRLVAECESVLFQFPSISSVSLVGHSLGGIYARYVIGRLLERGWLAQPDAEASAAPALAAAAAAASSSQGALRPRRLHASHFVTLATPHLGAQQIGKIVPLSAARWFVRKFLGATGNELMFQDQQADSAEPLLMAQLIRPPFTTALVQFHSRVAYANAFHDRTVPFCTAAICTRNPLRGAVNALELFGRFSEGPAFPRLISIDALLENEARMRRRDDAPDEIEWPPSFAASQLLRDSYLALSRLDVRPPSSSAPISGTDEDASASAFASLDPNANAGDRLVGSSWRRIGVLDRPVMAHTDIIVRNAFWNSNSAGPEVVLHLCQLFEPALAP